MRRDYMNRRNDANKEAVMNVYTNGEQTCRWCGQGDLDVLVLDHIKDDGKQHRSSGVIYKHGTVYTWIVSAGYPEGFQVLCFNCNMKKDLMRRRAARTSNSILRKYQKDDDTQVAISY